DQHARGELQRMKKPSGCEEKRDEVAALERIAACLRKRSAEAEDKHSNEQVDLKIRVFEWQWRAGPGKIVEYEAQHREWTTWLAPVLRGEIRQGCKIQSPVECVQLFEIRKII